MYSPTIEKLIKIFANFPTVGPRTAARFVFYLINNSNEDVKELLLTIEKLKKEVKVCPSCFRPFEASSELCEICSNSRRNKSLLCLVEKEMDLEAIEKTGHFKGFYFILNFKLNGNGSADKKMEKLINKIKENEVKELILAFNPTTEGKTIILWLKRKLQPLGIKVTQLGMGLPLGGELEYADEETLLSALENRK